jgi:type I restriction enzyme S subunit
MTMTPVWLLKHFEQISEAPDAIPRLRRFILDLAVRGKLVEQNPEDEPASDLLKRIEAEKERLTEAETIRDQKLPIPIETENTRFQIPKTWKWVHIEVIAHIEMGQSPSSEFYNQHHEGLPFYQGKADFGKLHPSPRYWCTSPTKLAEKGDILISVRAPVGPTNVSTETCCIGRGLAGLRPYQGYERDLLLLCLKQSESELEALGAGTTFVAINRKHLATFPVPLPPLGEQHRIVAKVDELMALCDKLEAAQAKRERRRDRLVAATLHGLNNGNDSSEPGGHPTFEESARFYFNHLPLLTTRPEHIHQLRQTILNLAVRGKLVPQDPNDEPANSLIAQIQAKRKQRASKGEPISYQISADVSDVRFPVPQSWKWVRLGVITNVLMGQSPPGETYNTRGEGTALINGPVEFSEGPFGITVLNQYTTAPTKLCKKGDLLLCVRGSTTGRTNVAGADACIGRGVSALQPLYADQFIRLFIWSWREQIINMGRGIAFPSISRRQIEDLPTPFPPLAEQHRIVAKVDGLMALCGEMEARLTTTATTRRQLLEATLSEALES